MKHPVFALLVALALALGAGVVVYWYVSGADDRALATQSPVTIYLAADEVPSGMTLQGAVDSGLVSTSQIPERLRPAGAIEVLDATNAGQVSLVDIPAGTMLMVGAFGYAVPEASALDVPDGLMAVSVQLDDPAKVGTFLRPGSRIAVFDTFERAGAVPEAEPDQLTRALLDDVLVLAVGATPESDEEAATPDAWAAPIVTLALDQAGAEKVVHATRTGQLYFALLGDGASVRMSQGTSDSELFD